MQTKEYQNIFKNESSHFFYVGTHQTTIKLLEKYLGRKDKVNILDAGCGTGLLLKKLSRFGKTWGIDVSYEALKYARKRKLKRLFHSSVEKLPFKNNMFDAVVCIDVLYHQKVTKDIKALSEFYRVLAPGGILTLKVPAYEWLRGHHDIIVSTKHRYTKKEIKEKFENTNFEIVKITYANSYLLPVALLKRFIVDKFLITKPASDVQKVPSYINNLFITSNTIENKLLGFTDLPFGLSVYAVCRKPKV